MVREIKQKNLFELLGQSAREIGHRTVGAYIVLVVLVVATTVTFALTRYSQDVRQRASENNQEFAPGQIVLQFKEDTDDTKKDEILKQHNAEQIDEIPQIKVKTIKVPDQALPHVLEALQKNPAVEFAQLNYRIKPDFIPNDPEVAGEWQLNQTGTFYAWDKAKATNLLVGLCDTGIDGNHPDLQAAFRADLGWNAVDGSNNWYYPNTSHGTGTAGLIAAQVNNGIGVAGIAYDAKIIPVEISNSTDGGAFVDDMAKCVTYTVDHGARIVNISYTGSTSPVMNTSGLYAQSKNALLFMAAGNSGTQMNDTNFPGVIVVSAVTSTEVKPTWSNWGNFIDITAPGSNVITTGSNGTYIPFSGTSAASPVAAAVAALIMGANPSLSALQVQALLFNNATDIGTQGYDTSFGWGRVNSIKAVNAAIGIEDSAPPALTLVQPVEGAKLNQFTTQFSTTTSDNETGIYKVEFLVDGQIVNTDYAQPFSFTLSTSPYAVGSAHIASAKAYDFSGFSTTKDVNVTIDDNGDKTNPTAAITNPLDGAVLSGSVVVKAVATDNFALHNILVYYDGKLLSASTANGTSGSYSPTWDTTKVANGNHMLYAVVTDANRNITTSISLTVNVQNAGSTITNTPTPSQAPLTTPTPTRTPTPIPPTPTRTPTPQPNDAISPTVSITSPSNGAVLKRNVAITISATATDNLGVTKVEFYVNGNLTCTDTSASYSCNWKVPGKPKGIYTISAKAYDSSGNSAVSAVNVTSQ